MGRPDPGAAPGALNQPGRPDRGEDPRRRTGREVLGKRATSCCRVLATARRDRRGDGRGLVPLATAAGSTAEGYLTISDRKKDVNLHGRGERLSPSRSRALYQHPGCRGCGLGIPNIKWGETVKALVVLKEGATATEADLVAHCRTLLAHYKCPTSIELGEAIARTATGKVQKFKLRAPYWEGRTRLVS